MNDRTVAALDAVMTRIAQPSRWLAAQTPAIEGWKAEDQAFASYCNNRDMGIKPEALARFYKTEWAASFEAWYQEKRRGAE